jgi:hypothetical protein
MLRFISAFAVSHIVRYGVHSRRESCFGQYLKSKNMLFFTQKLIYSAFLSFLCFLDIFLLFSSIYYIKLKSPIRR